MRLPCSDGYCSLMKPLGLGRPGLVTLIVWPWPNILAQVFFFKIYFMYVLFMCVCMCPTCVQCLWRSKEDIGFLETRVADSCESLWYWELNLRPLEKQPVLLKYLFI